MDNLKIFKILLPLICVGLLIYIIHIINIKKENCSAIQVNRYNGTYKINSFYSINDLNKNKYLTGKLSLDSDNIDTIDYDYKLKDFFIKTAYNCFCSGNFKNDYVDNCALKNCASYGVRGLDMQIFSVNGEPVISSTSINTNIYKEGYNKISLKNGLIDINNYFFQNDYFDENGNDDIKNNLKNDPLFLFLRLHYGVNNNVINNESMSRKDKQFEFYNKIYDIFSRQFSIKNFASTFFIQNYGENYDKKEKLSNMDMKDTKNKIFIFIILNDDPDYNTIKQSKLDKFVSLYGNEFNHYRFNEISDSETDYNINQFNLKEEFGYCMPSWSIKNTNYDFTKAMKKGTQFIGMNFQKFDTYLNYYNNFFIEQMGNENNDITSPYIKKPDHMIEFPIRI